jgi:hypothetical protein
VVMYFFSFPCLKFPVPGNILQKLRASLGLIFCVLVYRKFLGAFAKLRDAAISFVMSIRQSA